MKDLAAAFNAANATEEQAKKDLKGTLGIGLNTLNGRFKKIALDMSKATIIKETLNDSRLVIKTVDSATSLHREISGTASVSAMVGPNVQAGLEFTGSHETTFNALSTYCLIKITTSVYKLTLTEGYDLNARAKAMLNRKLTKNDDSDYDEKSSDDESRKKNNSMFFDKFGNACITSLTYGHEIIFVIQLRSTNKQKKDNTNTKGSVSVPNIAKFEGSLSTLLESIDSNDVINVSTYARGLDAKKLDVDSLDGLKVFLDSFDKFKTLLMTGRKAGANNAASIEAQDKSKDKDAAKPADASKDKVVAATAVSPAASGTVVNVYSTPPKSEAEEKPKTPPVTPPKEWDAILSYDTKPFYEISDDDGALYDRARGYDEEFLPYKNITAKILECYDRMDAFLQLIEYAENHFDLCEIGQNKAYRTGLERKKVWLESARKQLLQKLLNVYKNPFGQVALQLAVDINWIVFGLNRFSHKSLKFNEGLLLLKEVAKSKVKRSHYMHNFLLPVEIQAICFDMRYQNAKGEQVKLMGDRGEKEERLPSDSDLAKLELLNSRMEQLSSNRAALELLKRAELELINSHIDSRENNLLIESIEQEDEFSPRFTIKRKVSLAGLTVFERIKPGSYIDMLVPENQQKLAKPVTLYLAEFKPAIPANITCTVQAWGKLKGNFIPIMTLSPDQLVLAVANAPLNASDRKKAWQIVNPSTQWSAQFWQSPIQGLTGTGAEDEVEVEVAEAVPPKPAVRNT